MIPDLEFELINPKETVRAMAVAVSKDVKKSTRAGRDAHGRMLPRPKDGGRALIRSGRFFRSIMASPAKSRNKKPAASGKKRPPRYVVFAQGARDDVKDVLGKKRRARERTKQMRAAAVLGEAFGAMATGRGISSDFKRNKKKAGISLGRMRVHVVSTNAHLAGVLSVPPKDRRGKNGRRGVYRVFEASDRYRLTARDAAVKVERHRLTSKRSIKVGK